MFAFGLFLAVAIGIFRASAAAGIPDGYQRVVTATGYVVATGVVLVVIPRRVDRRSIREYGFDVDRRWWFDFVGAVGIGLLWQALIAVTYLGLGWASVTGIVSPGSSAFAVGMALTLLSFVGVGIWEETLFRGVFIINATEGFAERGFSPATAVWLAWLISSLTFGVIHYWQATGQEGVAVPVVLVSTTISGAYFGLAYVLTGNLGFPIGLHVSTNFAGVAVFGKTAAPGDEFPALIRLETTFPGVWNTLDGLNLFFVTLMLALVVVWVYATRREISVDEALVRAASDDDTIGG
ncbi:CPBP family intramembrane glutamic endopeptidase [Halopiger djelfimassiliensis]|uniref:CPBP family intramembrane glutamic endopeptidase n=1 Tax=Halopiger djelfimassiliensis TaxID=1293047 RepID=UPI000AA0EEDF|nr:type II CAAX endopeptidase family protein [Halopiger djelfimassiliensis]